MTVVEEANLAGYADFCKQASPFDVLSELTNGKVSGLYLLALRRVLARSRLPVEVINLLLVYFYKTFANEPYDRNDLLKIYDFWLKKQVHVFEDAIKKTALNINDIINR